MTKHKYYIEKLNNTKIVNLNLIEYLKESLKGIDKNSLCKGWDYLKQNLTQELKYILQDTKYQNIKYNSENVDFILNQLYTTEEINNIPKELIKQLGSFVYVWKDIEGEENKREEEHNLKVDLESKGFKEIKLLIMEIKETTEQFNKRLEEYYKPYDGLKVICVLDVTAIGVLGSYDKKKEIEGKLTYSDYHRALMIIPKRCKTRGHIIKNKCYIKEVA